MNKLQTAAATDPSHEGLKHLVADLMDGAADDDTFHAKLEAVRAAREGDAHTETARAR